MKPEEVKKEAEIVKDDDPRELNDDELAEIEAALSADEEVQWHHFALKHFIKHVARHVIRHHARKHGWC